MNSAASIGRSSLRDKAGAARFVILKGPSDVFGRLNYPSMAVTMPPSTAIV
jgi:hypothetical protein